MRSHILTLALFGVLLGSLFQAFDPSPVHAAQDNATEIFRQMRSAAGPGGAGLSGDNEDPIDIRYKVAFIIRAAFNILLMVVLVIILIAGVMWMTAGGNEEKAGTAKKILFDAVIGLIIIFAALSLTALAIKIATGNPENLRTQMFRFQLW